jgi:hypothetical protein
VENVEIVRQPMVVKAHSRRRPEERIYLRFPSVVAFVTRAILRLPPRSRPRRAVILRAAQSGFDGINRGDFEAAFVLYHPGTEFITLPTSSSSASTPSIAAARRASSSNGGGPPNGARCDLSLKKCSTSATAFCSSGASRAAG